MSFCRSSVCLLALQRLCWQVHPGQWDWTQIVEAKRVRNFLVHMPKNAVNNAELEVLNAYSLVIEQIQSWVFNKTPKICHKTYRVHGSINPYMSYSCHIEMTLTKIEQIALNLNRKLCRRKIYHGEKPEEGKLMAQE